MLALRSDAEVRVTTLRSLRSGRKAWVAAAAAIALLGVLGVLGVLGGCGPRAEPPEADGVPPAVDADDENALYALGHAELQRRFEITLRTLPPDGQSADARALRRLARLARAHARLRGECSLCASAVAALEVAARGGHPEACELGLTLARLRAREGQDLRGAHLAAYVLVQRFGEAPRDLACVAEAKRMLAVLADDQPPLEELRAALTAEVVGEEAAAPMAADTQAVDGTAFAAQHAQAAAAQLESLHVYGKDEGAREVRVVLGFDGVTAFHRGELPAQDGLPRRVVLDLADVRISPRVAQTLSVAAAGLLRVRIFELDAQRTRVSFDVEANAGYRLFFLTQPYRIIVDFREVSPRVAPGEALALRTIVLDPGHGGAQSGAQGPNGLSEAAVALSLALRVRKTLLQKLPGVRVVLTRDRDRTVTLEERAAIANGIDADLFVSIHLNASSSPSDRGGVSTFVLDTTDDVQALRLAARENEAAESEITGLQKIFATLYRKDQVSKSLEAAHAIHASTLSWGRRVLPELPDRGVKKALFYVLVGASMPAVLCEASFITRPDEAAALASDEYRQALSEGIAEGIVTYARQTAPSARAGIP